MKKYKKIIILTVISLSVYFIYLVTNKNNNKKIIEHIAIKIEKRIRVEICFEKSLYLLRYDFASSLKLLDKSAFLFE